MRSVYLLPWQLQLQRLSLWIACWPQRTFNSNCCWQSFECSVHIALECRLATLGASQCEIVSVIGQTVHCNLESCDPWWFGWCSWWVQAIEQTNLIAPEVFWLSQFCQWDALTLWSIENNEWFKMVITCTACGSAAIHVTAISVIWTEVPKICWDGMSNFVSPCSMSHLYHIQL
jgi:hypothetical protein